jgi:hypothetical protein
MEEQQTPSESNALDNFFNISFDAGIRAQIRQAAVWAKICAFCAFISYAISLIVALFGQIATSDALEGSSVGTMMRAGMIGMTLLVVLIGGVINYFLYRFAVSTIRGIDGLDSTRTNEGFNSLRIYFKICGIILIVALSLLLLWVLVFSAGLAMR